MMADERLRVDLIRSIKLSPLASIITDPTAKDNPIIAVNRAFEELTGYATHELLGKNCRLLTGPGTDPASSAALGRAVATATTAIVELVNYRKDGTSFLNAVMIAPVLDERGCPVLFLGTQMEVQRQSSSGESAADRLAMLTPRQRAVLCLAAQGKRNRQIGAELGLTEKTIKMHRSALMRRLGVASAAEAIRIAIQAGE